PWRFVVSENSSATDRLGTVKSARRRPSRRVIAQVGHGQSASGPPRQTGQDWSSWPTYEAAALGFRNYWYPVQWSSQIGEKPVPVTVCGERIALVRDKGIVYALHDRCPHRGVPLSLGRRQFPGTISCPYHGWTYGLGDGRLCAVITDG